MSMTTVGLCELGKAYVLLVAALLVTESEPEQDALLEKLDDIWYKMTPDEQAETEGHLNTVLSRTTPPPSSEF